MFLGIVCTPLAFVDRTRSNGGLALLQYLVLVIMSPMGVAAGLGGYGLFILGKDDILVDWLQRLAFGWNIWGSWGVPIGVLCIWLPAWMMGATLVASSWFSTTKISEQSPVEKADASKAKS